MLTTLYKPPETHLGLSGESNTVNYYNSHLPMGHYCLGTSHSSETAQCNSSSRGFTLRAQRLSLGGPGGEVGGGGSVGNENAD